MGDGRGGVALCLPLRAQDTEGGERQVEGGCTGVRGAEGRMVAPGGAGQGGDRRFKGKVRALEGMP